MPSPSSPRRRWVCARAGAALAVASSGVALAGCAHVELGSAEADGPIGTPAASCATTVGDALQGVASRVAGQAASGRTVGGAAARIARSTALGDAVARNDPAAVTTALQPLLRTQIKRIVVTNGGHVLVSLGHAAALGPVTGPIHDSTGAAVGRFALSTSKDTGIASLIHGLTGAQVVVRAGHRLLASTLAHPPALPASGTITVAGRRYTVTSLAGTSFPAGKLRISLLSPPADTAWCAQTPAATTANAVGAVAERVFRQERGSARTHQVLRHIADDPRFAQAVAADDPAALRAQIVRFFQDPSLHVVRIRATTPGGALVNDVGGPYVIAPASATVRLHGRAVGRVTASIQDDAGFIKLVHRFTGADVIVRDQGAQVPYSTLNPGPAQLPARGSVTYHGRSYRVFSFTATRFPSGPLRVSVLVR